MVGWMLRAGFQLSHGSANVRISASRAHDISFLVESLVLNSFFFADLLFYSIALYFCYCRTLILTYFTFLTLDWRDWCPSFHPASATGR